MIKMLKLAVLFGGKSTEHNISIVSGTNVIASLNKDKYEIYPIYIDREGTFYKYTKKVCDIKPLAVDDEIKELEKIDSITAYLADIDVVFPVLHGLYGEDGTIEGLLEVLGKKYVGCGVLSSAICMDKVYAKIIFRTFHIDVAKSMYLKRQQDKYLYIDDQFNEKLLSQTSLANMVDSYLKYPIFIKPSNSGSSVGVSKAHNEKELIKYLDEAFKYDAKVLIEEAIVGREVECAVLGNDHPVASGVGEVLSTSDFYTYEAKYKNKKSMTVVPADIEESTSEEIRKLALKAYRACDCRGLSRIDFFIEKDTDRIILNEINTMPGFTEISMYPMIMEHLGYTYSNLLDKLIELAVQD